MSNYKKKTKEELREEVKALSEEFENGLESLFQSNEYIQFLNIMAKRPNYSLRNNLLIYLQKPNATFVAGYKKFLNEFGHQVQKDEQGIRILAPVVHKYKTKKEKDEDNFEIMDFDHNDHDESEIEERTYLSFRVIHVFDISQTKPVTVKNEKGEDILSPKAIKLIESLSYLDIAEINANDDGYVNELLTAITNAVPIPIEYKELQKGLGGFFSFRDKDNLHIVLNSLYSGANAVETLVHEWAHYKLHNPYSEDNEETKYARKNDMEIQAESIAYVVLKHLGIDASCEALKYVASWSASKTTDDLKKSMEIIQKTSADLIAAISNILNNENTMTEQQEDWRTA